MKELERIDQELPRIFLTESPAEVVRKIDLIAELIHLVHHADESQSQVMDSSQHLGFHHQSQAVERHDGDQ
jgi:hypothetical protein